jgi:regulator of sigma E protease
MISILAFLFVFSVVVLIHEFGHFITAMMLGIKVYEFSIGFPFSPKIATLYRHQETAFTLRLLPLGGFVSFSNDINEGESLDFLKEPQWKRGIIISAGSIFNIVSAFLILIVAYMFIKQIHLFDAMIASLQTLETAVVGTVKLIVRIFSGNSSMANLSGPIGIAVMAGKAVNAGFANLLYFTGVLSLSIGILNLLPLPALDGSHLIILAIESLKKKPLSRQTYQVISVAGMAFFIILTLIISYKDIVNLIT